MSGLHSDNCALLVGLHVAVLWVSRLESAQLVADQWSHRDGDLSAERDAMHETGNRGDQVICRRSN